uniref:Endo/exonuclease/phosphatase domain-containing protein n=1 Tax=Strongyloides venezuelensis TaxID=75913 RepID=A0A0K0FQX2_STRVS
MILGICETKRKMVETLVLDDLYHCYIGKTDKRIEGMGFKRIIFDNLLQFTKTPTDYKIVAGDFNCELQEIDKTKYGCKYYELENEKSENNLVNKFSAISSFNIVNTKFVKRRSRRWT